MAAAVQAALKIWAPPPKLTVSQWAERHRVLSPESSAEPGKWNTGRAEYLRGFMDAASDPEVEVVVGMFAAQTGKTTAIENIIGFHIDQDPSPILVVLSTLELAEAFSETRLAPMVRDTDCLAEKVGDPRSRDSGNKIRSKAFPGGHLTLAGANSPSSLSSRPIRLVICDEVDRYPASAGTEGDPVALARKRTERFWNRKIILISTPGIKGFSRIEAAYLESDQRRYWVPCPHCGVFQPLRWAQVRWESGRPDTALYVCEHCSEGWTDIQRWHAVGLGEWRAGTTAKTRGFAGFQLSELYSTLGADAFLAKTVRNFLEAKQHVEQLKVWINTALAETWEEDAERVDAETLEGRANEEWKRAPAGILIVTAGVDVQDDRLEVELVGWGTAEESWSLEHKVLYGDPSGPFVWQQLDDLLLTRIRTGDGRELQVHAACVDTGGHFTGAASAFCKPRYNRRVYAIKGLGGAGKPIWPKRASKNNKARVNLFMVGVDAAKDMVLSRLKVREAGPGYCHFPKGREQEYFRQFTAERVVTKHVKGFPSRIYVKDPGARNEALDLRVYAYAALMALNVNWGRVAAAAAESKVRQPDLLSSERTPPPEYQLPAAVADDDARPAPARIPPPAARGNVVRSSFVYRP
jgi:phage terminase large subunit GpA-like protein